MNNSSNNSDIKDEVEKIKLKTKEIFGKISEYEKKHPTLQEKLKIENENKRLEEIKNHKTITPRTIESLKEEELDLEHRISKLKKHNSKIRSKIVEVQKMLEESREKEQELKDSLDFSYQMRLRLQKKYLS